MGRRLAVVVVGGGILGVSTAYWAARLGQERVALFEAQQLSAGATGRAAGIVTPQLWNPLDIELVKLSREEFDTVMDSGPLVRQVGLLSLAEAEKSRGTLDALRARMERAGIAARLIDHREIRSLVPNIHIDEQVLGCYEASSGYVNPTQFVAARGREAWRLGVQVFLQEPVAEIVVEQGRVRGVVTAKSRYETEVIVVTGGAWGRRLLRMAGVDVPLKPYRTWAALLQTPWPNQSPMLHDTLLDFYLRPEGDEQVLFGDGTELAEGDPDVVHDAPSWEFRSEVAAKFSTRFPGLSNTPLRTGWSGVDTATPDRSPLVGAVRGIDGLYCALGMQGRGVMRGPAIGRILAHQILGTRPPLDISEYDVSRFEGFGEFPIRAGFTLG